VNIRYFQESDFKEAKEIFALYWTDPEFLKELSEKLNIFLDKTDGGTDEQYNFSVAVENTEVVGIAGFRSAPSYLRLYTKTNNPAEMYVIAVKHKGRGIGTELRLKRIEEAKKLGFTEAVLYSPNSHSESWNFHDTLDFERVGEVIAPDGQPGQVWRKAL
jgi:L-amino acid N-acyltransferase YncA